MGASCSQVLQAGCTQLATAVRGKDEAADEDSDSEVETLREFMRRKAGLESYATVKAMEEESKRRRVLEQVTVKGGGAVQRAWPERVVSGVSTSMELGGLEFAVKSQVITGLESVERLAEDEGAALRSEKARLLSWQRPNQDEVVFASLRDGYRIGVVVDGHGPFGHEVADLVRDYLLDQLCKALPAKRSERLEEYRMAIYILTSRALEDAEDMLFSGKATDVRASGASACLVVHDQKKKWLFASWTGNCRAVLAEMREEGAVQVRARRNSFGSEGQSSSGRRRKKHNQITLRSVRFTQDHTLTLAEEKVRVESTGAEITPGPLGEEITVPGRKFPGIHFSRCLGDLVAKQLGVIAEPEVSSLVAEEAQGEDLVKIRFVILGSDGFWQFISDEEAVETVSLAGRQDVGYAVNGLVQRAREAWKGHAEAVCDFIDDISVLVFWL